MIAVRARFSLLTWLELRHNAVEEKIVFLPGQFFRLWQTKRLSAADLWQHPESRIEQAIRKPACWCTQQTDPDAYPHPF